MSKYGFICDDNHATSTGQGTATQEIHFLLHRATLRMLSDRNTPGKWRTGTELVAFLSKYSRKMLK